jgi:hypothetical protein
VFSGELPWVTRPEPLGPQELWAQGYLVCSLPGFLDLPPPPINWRRVEGGAEIACSQVTDVERLLHNTFSLVGRNILRPLWVSLKKGGKFCMCASGSLQFPSLPLVFVSAAFVSG